MCLSLTGVPGAELSEMLHHCSWAYEKFSNYIGCEDIVERAMDIILSPNSEEDSEPAANDSPQKPLPFSGIKLCVVGKSGTII